jgi:hypothetical protein
MADDWFVSADGKDRNGPHKEEEVVQMVKEGRLGPDALCWRQGLADWTVIRNVKEFADALPPPPPGLGEKASAGWSAIKGVFRKGVNEAVRKTKETKLRLKISGIRKECDHAFTKLGKELYEKGANFVSEESYSKQVEQIRAMHAQIAQLEKEIAELK